MKRSINTLKLYENISRLNEQRHLFSIRTTFIATMPIMIIGAFAVALNQMPIPLYQEFMVSVFGEGWKNFGSLIFNATTQIVTLMAAFIIGMNLANWYNDNQGRQIHAAICGMLSLVCYAILNIPITDASSLPFQMTGVTGLFVAIIIAIASTEMFIKLSYYREKRMFTDNPDQTVPQAFSSVIPAVAVTAIVAGIRMILCANGVEDSLDSLVYTLIRMPYQNLGHTFWGAFLFNISTHILWIFGVHGNNALDEIAQNIFATAIDDNIAACAMGMDIPNLITKPLFDAFVYMGGSGTTFCLVIALLIFGKVRSYRMLLRYALPTSLLNINEPLVFGLPIVLNPIYAIPFVLTPVVMLCTTSLAMITGMVPYTVAEISWTTPVFISGYLATKSVAGIILQVINVAIGVLIYAPFVRISEKMMDYRFKAAYNNLFTVILDEYTTTTSRKIINRPGVEGLTARRLALDLQSAAQAGETEMVYQPIVDSRTNTLHSVEALLRWKHPLHGYINPMLTIALAEESQFIDDLGHWILETGINQRAKWTKEGLPDFHVSINVSTQQLTNPLLANKLNDLLKKYNVPPHQVQIEMTETMGLINNDVTHKNLARIDETGCTLAMDDFGVGHSSLIYLRSHPVSTLKIDASLSRDIAVNKANREIIATIFGLCQQLEVDTIVEYVETRAQLDSLSELGIHLIQGYYYSPPVSAKDLPAFMEKLKTFK